MSYYRDARLVDLYRSKQLTAGSDFSRVRLSVRSRDDTRRRKHAIDTILSVLLTLLLIPIVLLSFLIPK